LELRDLHARIDRLEERVRLLELEIMRIKKGSDPMYFNEREGYLAGLYKAISAFEDARIALVMAVQRIQSEKRRKSRERR